MPAGSQWNARNSAVKRIVQELKEIQNDDNPDIVAEALEVMTAQIVGLARFGRLMRLG